jgi:inorganic triphosphatase YgiF
MSAAEERTYFVTFKTPALGIYTRTELEVPITERQAQLLLTGNLEAIHEEAIETAVTHLEGAKIYPVLHVENIRETWRINSTAGCVEICFDDVRYADADRTRCVREYGIELELKAGEVAFLRQIADALSKQSYFIPASQ